MISFHCYRIWRTTNATAAAINQQQSYSSSKTRPTERKKERKKINHFACVFWQFSYVYVLNSSAFISFIFIFESFCKVEAIFFNVNFKLFIIFKWRKQQQQQQMLPQWVKYRKKHAVGYLPNHTILISIKPIRKIKSFTSSLNIEKTDLFFVVFFFSLWSLRTILWTQLQSRGMHAHTHTHTHSLS